MPGLNCDRLRPSPSEDPRRTAWGWVKVSDLAKLDQVIKINLLSR